MQVYKDFGILLSFSKLYKIFVCLGFFCPLENFSLILRCHYYRWRAANLTYARHSWPSSSERSLRCHTYLDTGHSVSNGHLRAPMTHTYCRAFSSWAVITCFYDFDLSRLGFEHPTFRLRLWTLKPTAPPARLIINVFVINYITRRYKPKRCFTSASSEQKYLLIWTSLIHVLYNFIHFCCSDIENTEQE